MTNNNPYQPPNSELSAVPIEGAEPKRNGTTYSSDYNAAFKTGLLIQAVFAVATALVMDSGQIHRAFWVAIICQWAMVWMILFRRPMNPTRLDLLIVRYGIIPMILIVVGCGPWVLSQLGRAPS